MPPPDTILIGPSRGPSAADVREIWQYRQLLWFLVWRDLKVRYAQTALGVTWAVLQPVILMLTLSIFLGRLIGVPSDGVPYPLFVLAGLIPWNVFAVSLQGASNSLANSAQLVSKVYFPRLLLPLAAIGAPLVEFGVALLLLLTATIVFVHVPGLTLLWLPLGILIATIASLGVGIWLAALNVRYRDVRYTVPLLLQVWLWSSPVAYPTSIIPNEWQLLWYLNPMTGAIDSFRWAVLGTGQPSALGVALSSGVAALLLLIGVIYFFRAERAFADVI
jgi:lipopolysaccharide transport system permease protein